MKEFKLETAFQLALISTGITLIFLFLVIWFSLKNDEGRIIADVARLKAQNATGWVQVGRDTTTNVKWEF